MFGKPIIFVLLVSAIILLGCCGALNSPAVKYVCADGKEVSDKSLCTNTPQPPSAPQLSECTYECCQSLSGYQDKSCQNGGKCNNNKCEYPVFDSYGAISRLSSRADINADWSKVANNANCRANELTLSNAIVRVVTVDFDRNTIQCENMGGYSDFEKSLPEPSCPSGVCVMSGWHLWPAQEGAFVNCSQSMIGEYEKMVKGSSSMGTYGNIDEKCVDCGKIYFLYGYCTGGTAFSSGGNFFGYVDAKTGKVYQ